MISYLYALFRKYCREYGKKLILGTFDQFVFIYFIILLINCQKQPAVCVCVLGFVGARSSSLWEREYSI